MSQSDLKTTGADSEGTGLTFVRPLPGGRSTPIDEGRFIPSSPREKMEFASLLFPPKLQEDSGSLPPVTGLEIGHFVVEERIGRGGMGAVFRAIDRRLDRVVALKILSPDLSSDPDAVQRFQNEARAAAKLDHDNIARVHYFGEDKGLHFIAFEFVTGTNVREFILQKGRLSPESVVNYTLQIAEALRQTAAANVVHRDIKPSNIIVSPTGRAKLVDLGLARHHTVDQSQDLTVAGTALGTFDYIAPEQAIDARNVDVRSDIYSLGCTMYHMLTGEPPYPKGTMFQKVMNHHGRTPPDPRIKNPQVSVQLSRVVQRMMSSNPDERYATPDALIHDLIQIAESLNLSPTYPESVVWTTPLFKTRSMFWDGSRTWMAVALVLLLLVYLVDRLQPGPQPVVASTETSSGGLGDSPAENSVSGIGGTDLQTKGRTGSSVENLNGESLASNEVALNSPDMLSPSLTDDVNRVSSAGGNGNNWQAATTSERTAEFWNSLSAVTPPVRTSPASTQPPISNGGEPRPPMPTTPQGDGTPPATFERPFVVTQSKSGVPEEKASLAEAFAAAADNSAIEIQGDGIVPIQKSSIQLSGKRVILRAKEGSHPVIRFDLSEELTLRPLASRAAVFEVGNGGALEVYDVDLELIVDPRTTVDEWAIVNLAAGAEFDARWSTFTINNPEEVSASLVLIPSSSPADIPNLMPDRMSRKPSIIQIRDCLCRGEMNGIRQLDLHPIDILFEETAFALSGALHRIDGSNSVETNMSAVPETVTSLRLNHVSAILGEGLIRATTGDHGTLEAFNVSVRNSVIRVQRPEFALVSLAGHLDADVLKDKILWQSQSDQTFVQVQGPVFTVESSASFLFDPEVVPQREFGASVVQTAPDDLLFDSSHWDLPIVWHSVRPSQLFLDETGGTSVNPALKSASDGRNAGVDWTRSRLPQVEEIRQMGGRKPMVPEIEF